ncbi:MAG: fimbrillin family protein [Bacteroides sp.]|nr:fimbrillin family protein [Bacteroides sp.]
MKHIEKHIAMWAIAVLAVACSDDKEEENVPQTVKVSFTTEVQTRATSQVVTDLEKDGSTMSVFVGTGSSLSNENAPTAHKATRQGGTWNAMPSIELEEGEKCYLFAGYPYMENSNPQAVPVNIKSQTDYLYSGSGVSVSYAAPTATLKLKHALCLLGFNIKKDNYDGEGKLQAISISGDGFYTEGLLNLQTGNIQGITTGSYTHTCNATLQANGWTTDIPEFFCLPPITSTGENLTVSFKIDGKEYTCPLPKYSMARGIKYTFRLSLTDKNLTIFNNPEIYNLDVTGDQMPDLEFALLKITHTNPTFYTPTFTGYNFMGIAYWGDGQQENFSASATHDYATEAPYSVSIETWGAESISLQNIKGITEIDFTEF